ncbi:choice-of-anchor Q domain-containing protein [Flavobacterium sp. DGU11]|uniref:Choice-of-anchor Q domain-containing protein n=1 Tax=Flavobacterium arundinis TaxID=3139143 RepID=A0ABU9HSZ4_9FLAO
MTSHYFQFCKPQSAGFLLLLLFGVSMSGQTIRYVKQGGTGNGTSWANASGDLQGMIDAANTEQVWVATGTYKPTLIVGTGTNDRHKSFLMKINVKIFGGFAGNETAASQRNWTDNVTVLSGDMGLQDNDVDNAYQVVTSFGNAGTAELNGFTITKGNANGATWVYINDVQIFKGYTNAILNWESSPAYSNLKITNNKGGAYTVYSRQSLSVFDNVTISNNTANDGAIYFTGLSAILRNTTVSANTGTGIRCEYAIPDLTNVTVCGNTKGIYYANVNSSTFKNILVNGNAGDAVYLSQVGGYSHMFDNVTISGNAGYSIFNNNSQSFITIRNSIIRGNQYDVVSSKLMYNSLVQGNNDSSSTNGNVHGATDPLFEYEPPYTSAPFSDGDYNLRPCSTLVNYGNNNYAGNLATDIAGNPRIYGQNVDFGAFELQEPQSSSITFQPSAPTTQQFIAGATVSNLEATGSNLKWYRTATGGQPLALQAQLATGSYYVSQTLNGCEGYRSHVNVTINYPEIVFVKPIAMGNGSGTNWENASADLQGMVNATGVQQVWVAAGTYKPAIKAGNGTTEQHKAFVMKSNVKIYGGFAGTETVLEQRDPAANSSILSGDLGIEGNTSDNAYHVVICSGYIGTATLDGFTVSHGYARYHTPSLTHTVNGNTIEQYGGGIYCTGSAPLFGNIILSENTGDDGMAMFVSNYSTVTISKLSVRNNTGNQSVYGTVAINLSTLFLTDAIFSGNNRTALYSYASTCNLTNTAITGNLIDGIYNLSGTIELRNVTISGNGSYGIRNDGTAALYNTLVYGNQYGTTGNYSINYSLVQGADNSSNGNFNGFTDPLFVYAPSYTMAPFTSGDYRLQSCSPVLNAGNNGYASNISADLEGYPRIYSAIVDLGAYECQFNAHTVPPAPGAEAQNFDDGATISNLIATGTDVRWYAAPIGGAPLDGNTPALSGTYYVSQTVDGCESARTPVSITVDYPPIRYVKAVASGSGDGTSWADASADLQAMINAPAVQQVWVAGGQYQPQSGGSFSMKAGVKLYGGFPALGNPGMSARNIRTYQTVLNGNGSSVINNNGNGLTNTALLDGFIIQGGNAYNGGGMYNSNSYPAISNCIFRNNTADNWGGALLNSGNGNTSVTNCLFYKNQAGRGGAVYETQNAHTVYINATLVDNLAISDGGAVYTISNAYAQFYNCILHNNMAYGYATQVFVGYQSTAGSYYSMVMGGNNAFYNQFSSNNSVGGTPLFTDALNGDYTLQAISPGVDAGNISYFANADTAIDLSGGLRLFGESIDVGAYEYKPECAVTTEWDGTSWSNGTPASYEYSAIINGDFDSADNGEIIACSIIVNSGDVVIEAGNNFKIKGAVTIDNNNATFTVQQNANLIQIDDVDNTGTIHVIKESAPMYRLDYALWSSPVAGQKLKTFSPQTLDNRFYTYNPLSDAYATVAAPAATDFIEGKSYLIRVDNTHPAYVSDAIAPTPWEGTFTGVPNNGNVNVSVTGMADDIDGYNGIGNPYPSSINIAAFFEANQNNLAEDSPIYFWRKKNDAGTSSYASLTLAGYNQNSGNAFGDSSNGVFDNPNDSGNWVINPGQGFIVQATGSTVTFNNEMRVAVNNGQMFRTAQDSGDKSRLWLNLTNSDDSFGQATIAYTPFTTLGRDFGWDGKALTDGEIAIYSLAGENKFGIQARPAFDPADEVPIECKITVAGNYTISLDHFDGVFTEGQEIFLRDNVLGITHNLESPYQFTTDAGIITGRFDVVYAETLVTDIPAFDSNNIIVYKKGSAINISTGNVDMKSVAVYDIRGRLLYSANDINSATTSITNLQAQDQMLIVEVITVEGVKAGRKIVF